MRDQIAKVRIETVKAVKVNHLDARSANFCAEGLVFLADEIIILSGKRAKVIGKIKNPLLYPRTIEVLKTEKFNEIKNKALKIFQSEVNL